MNLTLLRSISWICSVALLSGITACRSVPKGDSSLVTDAKDINKIEGISFAADTVQSRIEWIGTKPAGRHHGTLKLQEGKLLMNDNKIIIGGHFVIDINTLTPDDQKAKGNSMLQKHLLSDDFFDVLKFPVASFAITAVRPANKTTEYMVSGNLRMKDVTKNISFPARIKADNKTVVADALFNMDRTLWNMHYGSDRSLGDWFISPDVNIKLHLVAHQQ
jgi:polyisoprenoid-binding protein YceI